ncbi:MAG: hypothetical protein Q9195_003064 [Heterodermia aff. obscurata]
MASAPILDDCSHNSLFLKPSDHACKVGYRDYTAKQLSNAAGNSKGVAELTTSFPRPLVLPGDDLSEDPRYPGQSLRSWIREPDRNEVTRRKNVIYVASPPAISRDIKMDGWALPEHKKKGQNMADLGATMPGVDDVENFLGAFYTGMKTARLSPAFSFVSWEKPVSSKANRQSIPRYIGLRRKDEVVGIRTRPSPDGMFQAQFNLDDVLDAAISALPEDAYALLLLVHQDLYKDEEDDFCCGLAYGGSRVAVVSSARYNPSFDEVHKVERIHAWPASHCEAYINAACESAEVAKKRPSKKRKIETTNAKADFQAIPPSSNDRPDPIHAAVEAHYELLAANTTFTAKDFNGLWTARVCRTASHELGHCFGMDHCVYYACVMQSTASLAEDVRQPPYLCPVDLVKVQRATGATEVEHYVALAEFCDARSTTHMFAALSAWIKARLLELEGRKL